MPALRPREYRPEARAAMGSALSGSRPCTDFTSPSQDSRTALLVCGTRCTRPLISQSRSDTWAVGASLAMVDRLLGVRRSAGALGVGVEGRVVIRRVRSRPAGP